MLLSFYMSETAANKSFNSMENMSLQTISSKKSPATKINPIRYCYQNRASIIEGVTSSVLLFYNNFFKIFPPFFVTWVAESSSHMFGIFSIESLCLFCCLLSQEYYFYYWICSRTSTMFFILCKNSVRLASQFVLY